ncbi:MAG: hypothetical protein QM756_16760 [Polyangiaceae bacterium]
MGVPASTKSKKISIHRVEALGGLRAELTDQTLRTTSKQVPIRRCKDPTQDPAVCGSFQVVLGHVGNLDGCAQLLKLTDPAQRSAFR